MFKFKGISSEDMQVIIEEEEHFIARASQRYETIEIEGRDGAIFNELGYSVVERPIYVQCLNINKIDNILAWLNGEGEFEYKGRKTTARFYSELEPQRSSCIRIIDTTFIRDPFWYKANEKYIIAKERKDKTAEGETIDITDSAEMRFSELNISGNSKQETREGYNLLNLENLTTITTQGVTVTNNKDGSFTLNGTSINSHGFTVPINNPKTLKANTDYTIRTTHSGSATSYSGSLIGLREEEGTNLITKNFTDGKTTYTPTEDVTINYTRIYFDGGVTFTNLTIYPMLYQGTEEREYEQYGASPNPNYPSEVESCWDNVNLFDKDTITSGSRFGTDGAVITDATAFLSEYIEIQPNTDYVVNYSISYISRICEYDKDKNLLVVHSSGSTFTTNSSTAYVRLTQALTELDNTKFEKGKVATPYSPYGQGCINEVICNKNLFDKKNANILNAIINGTTKEIGSFNTCRSIYIACDKNEDYSISRKSGTRFVVGTTTDLPVVGTICNQIVQNNTGNSITITTTNADNYLVVFYYNSGSDTLTEEEILNSIQIEKGSEATEKVEHQSQTFTIPTQQPMRAIGDVRDTFIKVNNKWYERHKINRIIFDGINNKMKSIWIDSTNKLVHAYFKPEDSNYTIDNLPLMSNKFIQVNSVNLQGLRYGTTNGDIRLQIDFDLLNEENTTVDNVNSWLTDQYNAGTPVYVDYVLAEPIDIECTEEQSTILWDIEQNAKTYKNITHMYSTDKISPVIELIYFTPTNETINNEGNIQSRPILRLEKTVSEAVELTINDIRFKYDFGDDSYTEIDCEEKAVKYEGLNRNRKITIGYEFPKLNIGSNKIVMHDGDCIIKILRKDRWL